MTRRTGGEENWGVGFPGRPVHPVITGLITNKVEIHAKVKNLKVS